MRTGTGQIEHRLSFLSEQFIFKRNTNQHAHDQKRQM
jgi:hypothetical protein